MGRGLDIEDSDAFFNMRRRFWEESRDRALAKKEQNKPFIQQSQEGSKLAQSIEIEKSYGIAGRP